MNQEFEKRVREIYQEMFDENYNSGAPRIPPHTHNGIDNLPVKTSGGGSGTPGGDTTQIQFNDDGVFAGDAGLAYDKTTGTLQVNNINEVLASGAPIQIFTNDSGEIDIFTSNILSGNAGGIFIFTGGSPNARGGEIEISTGTITTGGGNAGNITLLGGANFSSGGGFASSIDIIAGDSSNAGFPGTVSIYGGDSSSADIGAGVIVLQSGSATSGDADAGSIYMNFGSGHGAGLRLGNLIINGGDFAQGAGVIAINDATTTPSATPSSGGVLYIQAGALKYKGSGGTVTTIASA